MDKKIVFIVFVCVCVCVHICICNSTRRGHEFEGGRARGWAHRRVWRKERKGRNGVIIYLNEKF